MKMLPLKSNFIEIVSYGPALVKSMGNGSSFL